MIELFVNKVIDLTKEFLDNNQRTKLKKLDAKAKETANIFSYSFGIIMTLVLGTGMCLAMKVIGEGTSMMILGIVIGIIGIIGVSINYPIYKVILEKNKEKYGPTIITLAKEIIDEE